MFRVGIIGPESTGKSSLAHYLSKRYKGVLVPEYARDYIAQRLESGESKEVSYDQVCEIAKHQIEEMERLAVLQPQLVFFDTELIVTKVWFDYAFGRVPEWLDEAIEKYPMDAYLLTKPPCAKNYSSAMNQRSKRSIFRIISSLTRVKTSTVVRPH